jgi:lambda family phage portal protein
MATLVSTLGGWTRDLGARLGLGGGAFEGGRSDTQETAGWTPTRAHMDQVYASQGRGIVDRAEDLDRNSPWINGALDRMVESVIGSGLQPWPTPIYDALGRDAAWAMKQARSVRARWRVWAEDPLFRCDARMRFSLGTLTKIAYLNFRRGGEVLAEIRIDERGASNPLNLLLIDPKRLQNPMGVSDTDERIRNGIEHDANGVPVAAHVLVRHPDDASGNFDRTRTERVPFRGATGTPKLIHVINPRYIEQSRGFSQLAEAIVPAKMLERYDRAEINAALLSAVMAFFIKSPGTPEDLAAAIAPSSDFAGNPLTEYVDYRNENPIRQIGDAMIRQLLPDEDVITVQPKYPNPNYPEFQKAQLAKIGVSQGMSYPQISGNWAEINYSSARAMLNEVWRAVEQEREYFAAQFMQPILVGWHEIEVAQGTVKIPGRAARFYRDLSALTNCTWIGPSRGTVDPLKEANARNLEEAAYRRSPIEHILEDGRDPFEVWDQIKLSRDALDERGLDQPNYNIKAASESEDGASAGTESDRDGDGEPNEDRKKKGKPASQGDGQ